MPNTPNNYGAGPSVANPATGAFDLNGQRLKNLPLPGADTDAARARDVPAIVARAMTITGLSSYAATATVIEANSVGAVPVDGLTPAVDDLVIVNVNSNLSAHVDNGIYRVTVVGDVSHKLKLTRDPRFTAAGSIYAGLSVVLTEGNSIGAVGVPVTVATTGAITPGTTAFAWNLPVVANPLIATLNANSKTITAAVLTSSTVGSSSTRTTYDGATKVLSSSHGSSIAACGPLTPRRYLTADTLTVTIDESTWVDGDTVEFWSTTESNTPGHTFSLSSSGKFKFANSGGAGSGVTSFTWPTGATCVVITRLSSGVYLRS